MLLPPEDCPLQICEIMKSCWKTEPKDRIQFSDIHDRLSKCIHDFEQQSQQTTLPRPPAFPVGLSSQLSKSLEDDLDSDNYLQPQIAEREYLQPLPD